MKFNSFQNGFIDNHIEHANGQQHYVRVTSLTSVHVNILLSSKGDITISLVLIDYYLRDVSETPSDNTRHLCLYEVVTMRRDNGRVDEAKEDGTVHCVHR